MKRSTGDLFLKPFMLQEAAIIIVLAPMVVILFRTLSQAVNVHFMQVGLLASIAANLGLLIGALTKYLPLRQAIRIMETGSATPEKLTRAVQSLAVLPGLEAMVCLLRFGISGNLIAPVALYYMQYINLPEFLFAVNAVFMMGILLIPIVYLISENSLATFYENSDMQGVLDSRNRFFRLSVSSKTAGTMLLTALPAFELVLSLIIMQDYLAVDKTSLKIAIGLITVETISLMFFSGYLLMKNLRLSVGNMSVIFRDMAKGRGDLTKRLPITSLNEIGELSYWFNEFMNDLEGIISHVRKTSLELHRAIEGVNSNYQGLSQATQEQASTVEQVASSINEMNTTINSNADLVSEGQATSQGVTKLIDQSKGVFGELTKSIREVSMDSRRIGDIVSTVNEVAFHTNLLALNASVEAARAGEHGRGFAVVAEEVRSLAQRSAGAAGEIKQLIEGTVGRIKNSDEMVDKTSSALEELMSRMDVFFRMMEAVSSSSSEQLQSISELNRAITQIDTSTQGNATTVEELAGTLGQLRTMASALAKNVRKFKVSDTAH